MGFQKHYEMAPGRRRTPPAASRDSDSGGHALEPDGQCGPAPQRTPARSLPVSGTPIHW